MTLSPPPRRVRLAPQAWFLFAFHLLLIFMIGLGAWRAASLSAGLPAWFPALIFFVPLAFVLVVAGLFARALVIQVRLLRDGVIARGKVTDITYIRGAYWITYDFVDAAGANREGRAAVNRAQRPEQGGEVTVIATPRASALLPFTMVRAE